MAAWAVPVLETRIAPQFWCVRKRSAARFSAPEPIEDVPLRRPPSRVLERHVSIWGVRKAVKEEARKETGAERDRSIAEPQELSCTKKVLRSKKDKEGLQ